MELGGLTQEKCSVRSSKHRALWGALGMAVVCVMLEAAWLCERAGLPSASAYNLLLEIS